MGWRDRAWIICLRFLSQCSDYEKVYVSKSSFVISLRLFEFFIGEIDAGQVFLLEDKENLTAVVFKWLTEFHREISEQTKHQKVSPVDTASKERIGD